MRGRSVGEHQQLGLGRRTSQVERGVAIVRVDDQPAAVRALAFASATAG
jgi:hypothetical protein